MIKNNKEYKINIIKPTTSNKKSNNPKSKEGPPVDQINSNVKSFLYSLINNKIADEDIIDKNPLPKQPDLLHSSKNAIISNEDKKIISFKQSEGKSYMKEMQDSLLSNTEAGLLNNKAITNQSNDGLISDYSSKNMSLKCRQMDSLNNEEESNEMSNKNDDDDNKEDDVAVKDDESDSSSINKIIDLNKTKRKEFSSICDKFKSSIIFNGQSLSRFNEKLRIAESKSFFQNDTLDLDELNRQQGDRLFRHIERKEHVFDSISESEEDEIVNSFFIDPNSTFAFYFDMVIGIFSLYTFIFVPIDLAFNLHDKIPVTNWRILINAIITIVFMIDFIVSFFVAYFTFEDEQLMTDVYDIAINYLKSWFILDLLSATPLDLILKWKFATHDVHIFTNHTVMNLQFLRIFQILKLLKIIFKNAFMASIYSLCIDNHHLNKWFRVYISIIFYFLCNHLLCCIFIFLAKLDYPNWIVRKNLEYSNKIEVYVASLYFIFTTIYTIGYGDICSYSDYERIFNIMLLIVGIMAYSYALSALSNFVMEEDYSTAQFRRKLAILEEISHSNKCFTDSLFKKIYLHLKYKLKNDQNSFKEIISDLPFGLRNTLIYEMYRPVIENFIFFKSFDNIEFIIRVILAMKPAMVSKNDKLVKEGDFVEEIYFVKRGNLVIEIPLPSTSTPPPNKNKSNPKRCSTTFTYQDTLFNNKKRRKSASLIIADDVRPVQYIKLLEIRRNEHFGDVLMFSNRKSPLALKVKSKIAELFLLAKTDAVEISMQFPNIWRTIIKKSLYNMEQIEKLLNKSIHNFLMKNMASSDFDAQKKFKNQNRAIPEEELKDEKTSFVHQQSQLSKIEEGNSQDNDDEDRDKEEVLFNSALSRNISSTYDMPIKNQYIEIISNSTRSMNSICSENLSMKTKDLHYVDICEILPTSISTNGANTLDNSTKKITDETNRNEPNNDQRSQVNSDYFKASLISQTIVNQDNNTIETASSFKIKASNGYYPTNHPSVFIKGSKLSVADLDLIIQELIIINQNRQEFDQCRPWHYLTDIDHPLRDSSKQITKTNTTNQVPKQKDINIDDKTISQEVCLSRLDFNIRKSSQNLKNPESFYSQYFHSVLNNKKSNEIMTELEKKVDDFFEFIKKNNTKKTD